MQKIAPFLWFDGKAEEAAEFYTSVFKNSKILNIARYGDAGPGPKGTVMMATFHGHQGEGFDLIVEDLLALPDNPPVYLLLANIHIQRKDYPALIRDLDDYLRLAPIGPEADQARKTREHVQALLNASKDDTDEEESDQDEPQKDADPAHPAPQKATPPATEPDTSGLPSLPPPTPGNQ